MKQHAILRLASIAALAPMALALAAAKDAGPTTPAQGLPIARPAAAAPRAPMAVLLGAARAGSRLVAVGERGIVLLSDDEGRAWRQTSSPASVTLTAVRFASPTVGWATGHAGVILATEDGGIQWRPQLDGAAAAASALQQARGRLAAAPADPVATRAVADAERLVADGPDKPFFDLWFSDTRHGFAIGAYNLFVRTQDGGATWVAALDRLPNARGNHLYAIAGRGLDLYIAGEQGLLLRSRDGGERFDALASPYAGSFFTLALLPGGELIAAGLRGKAFRSTDQGDSWQEITGLPSLTWVASAVADDGTVWLGNQAGQIFASRDAGLRWLPVAAPPGPPSAPLTGLLAIAPGTVLTTTMRGPGRAALAQEFNK